MLAATTVTLVIILGFGQALRSDKRDQLIVRRPYNNRHNDASGARDHHFI